MRTAYVRMIYVLIGEAGARTDRLVTIIRSVFSKPNVRAERTKSERSSHQSITQEKAEAVRNHRVYSFKGFSFFGVFDGTVDLFSASSRRLLVVFLLVLFFLVRFRFWEGHTAVVVNIKSMVIY